MWQWPRGAGAQPGPALWLVFNERQVREPLAFTLLSAEWDEPPSLADSHPVTGCSCVAIRRLGIYFYPWSPETTVTKVRPPGLLRNRLWLDPSTAAGNPQACLERGRNFTLRNDNILSQALGCFINAGLIWGKRKTGCSIRGSFMRRELAMFWNKKQLLHQGTYGIIIAFSKAGRRAARERGAEEQ